MNYRVKAVHAAAFCLLFSAPVLASPVIGSPGGVSSSLLSRVLIGSAVFVTGELLLVVLFFLLLHWLGRRVVEKGWNVNVARDMAGAALVAIPSSVGVIFGVFDHIRVHYASFGRAALFDEFSSSAFLPFVLFPLGAPILLLPQFRRRSLYLATAFAAIDRPECRPHSLFLFTSSCIASVAILIVAIIWAFPKAPALTFAIYIAVTLGDLSARIVSARRVAVGAPANERRSRSLDGGACMFFATWAAILLTYSELSPLQFALMTPGMSVAMAVAKAFAPRCWDDPFVLLTGLIVGSAILFIA